MQSNHSMAELFAQLGRDSHPDAIQQFVDGLRPVSGDVRLHEVPVWAVWQAAFLKEAVLEDADWCEVVEQLNADLHAPMAGRP